MPTFTITYDLYKRTTAARSLQAKISHTNTHTHPDVFYSQSKDPIVYSIVQMNVP